MALNCTITQLQSAPPPLTERCFRLWPFFFQYVAVFSSTVVLSFFSCFSLLVYLMNQTALTALHVSTLLIFSTLSLLCGLISGVFAVYLASYQELRERRVYIALSSYQFQIRLVDVPLEIHVAFRTTSDFSAIRCSSTVVASSEPTPPSSLFSLAVARAEALLTRRRKGVSTEFLEQNLLQTIASVLLFYTSRRFTPEMLTEVCLEALHATILEFGLTKMQFRRCAKTENSF